MKINEVNLLSMKFIIKCKLKPSIETPSTSVIIVAPKVADHQC